MKWWHWLLLVLGVLATGGALAAYLLRRRSQKVQEHVQKAAVAEGEAKVYATIAEAGTNAAFVARKAAHEAAAIREKHEAAAERISAKATERATKKLKRREALAAMDVDDIAARLGGKR